MNRIDRIFIGRAVDSAALETDGGEGSGNFGHKGRPGQVGGSGKGGGLHYKGGNKHVGLNVRKELNKQVNQAYESWERKDFNQRKNFFDWYYGPGSTSAETAYSRYSYKWDGRMNSLLRGGAVDKKYLEENKGLKYETVKCIKKMTEDIDRHEFGEPVVLHRSIKELKGAISALGLNISAEDFEMRIKTDSNFLDSLIGYTYRDNGFTSTSITQGLYPKGVQLEIVCPAGTKGTYIESVTQCRGEQEVILQRGTQFAITDYSREDGILTLTVSVIGQEPQEIPEDYFEEIPKDVPNRYKPKISALHVPNSAPYADQQELEGYGLKGLYKTMGFAYAIREKTLKTKKYDEGRTIAMLTLLACRHPDAADLKTRMQDLYSYMTPPGTEGDDFGYFFSECALNYAEKYKSAGKFLDSVKNTDAYKKVQTKLQEKGVSIDNPDIPKSLIAALFEAETGEYDSDYDVGYKKAIAEMYYDAVKDIAELDDFVPF